MPRYIVRIENAYFEWSTVCDAPVSEAMSREEFTQYCRDLYGKSYAEKELPERLARADATGISAKDSTLEGVIGFNRAGPKETCLSIEELRERMVPERLRIRGE